MGVRSMKFYNNLWLIVILVGGLALQCDASDLTTEQLYLDLGHAAYIGDVATVWAILASGRIGVDSHSERYSGNTALHDAALGGHREVVQLLLDNNANLNARNKAGETPIMLAVRHSRPEVAELLRDAGADFTLRSNKGESARDLCFFNDEEDGRKLVLDQAVLRIIEGA